ncbi:MAG: hypothetical protein MJK18_15435, partial [Bdellovibrionales bacterium]|nr:hypothetical protein [Bdellovibrionales bacterium]
MIYNLLFIFLSFPSHYHQASVGTHYVTVDRNKFDNGYKEERYHFILDKVIEIYRPLIKDRNGTFDIMRDWSDGAVNMWAWRWGDEYWLEVPGGMARYHLINEEAFLMSVCHEIGHLL